MCGIAGFIDLKRSRDSAMQALTAMSAPMQHRGPDGEGYWFEDGVGLAHRRLAIIDLSETGHQPMLSRDRRWVISLNGEVYNHLSLRETLKAQGHTFAGSSDTETLVNAIAQWGIEEALQKASGMFAFAAFDRQQRQLWLARDRAGEKPLYYAIHDDTLIFASTLSPIEAFPGFRAEIDRQAVAALIQRGYIPAPLSIYRNTWKVRPAHCIRIDATHPGLTPVEHSYWSLPTPQPVSANDQSHDAKLDRLDETLMAAVEEQMISDRPIGAFLSGGVDSSLVTALMQEVASRPVRTFTIGFADPAFNEAEHARAVAEHLGTEHSEVYLEPDAGLELIERLPQIYDEPFADSSQLPTLLLSEVARRHVVVALSGDGGDELFAGYDRYLSTLNSWHKLRKFPAPLRRLASVSMRGASKAHVDSWLPKLLSVAGARDSRRSAASALAYWSEWIGTPDLATLYARSMSSWYHADVAVPDTQPSKAMPMRHPSSSPTDTHDQGIRALMQWDFLSYLPDDILVKVDRASMFYGLETRAPLLDRRIISLTSQYSNGFLTSDGRGKYPLRSLLARRVPTRLFDRRKQGFAVPVDSWLRGPLLAWADRLLSAELLNSTGLLNVREIQRRWAQHREGIWDNGSCLWPVLMFMAWFEQRA